MLYVHPLIQDLGLVFFLVALYYGFQRFRQTFLRQKAVFPWNRHVAAGAAAYGLWIVGYFVGMWAAESKWGDEAATGLHEATGTALLVVILCAAALGWTMNLWKKPRKALPLIHMSLGATAFLLFLFQAATGIRILWIYVLPH